MPLFGNNEKYYDPSWGSSAGSIRNPWQEFWSGVGEFFTNPFDITGKNAAQRQFENQVALDNSARAYNSDEAQKQRDWEEMMSNTQYQRAFNDIKRAGYNPWIALQNGSMNGSTPSGSSASSSSGSSAKADNKSALLVAGIIATALKMFLKK